MQVEKLRPHQASKVHEVIWAEPQASMESGVGPGLGLGQPGIEETWVPPQQQEGVGAWVEGPPFHSCPPGNRFSHQDVRPRSLGQGSTPWARTPQCSPLGVGKSSRIPPAPLCSCPQRSGEGGEAERSKELLSVASRSPPTPPPTEPLSLPQGFHDLSAGSTDPSRASLLKRRKRRQVSGAVSQPRRWPGGGRRGERGWSVREPRAGAG